MVLGKKRCGNFYKIQKIVGGEESQEEAGGHGSRSWSRPARDASTTAAATTATGDAGPSDVTYLAWSGDAYLQHARLARGHMETLDAWAAEQLVRVYNRKTSRVYRYCSKVQIKGQKYKGRSFSDNFMFQLAEIFEAEIDPVISPSAFAVEQSTPLVLR